jgi:outer membrane protein assembly factor BamB
MQWHLSVRFGADNQDDISNAGRNGLKELRVNMIKSITVLFLSILLVSRMCYADDWPGFRGRNRDGKSAETGLLQKWPEGGPELLWSVEGLGIGFSSVAIAGGFAYTTGMLEGEGVLFAYNLDGKLQWKESYGPEWSGSHKSARTTPTIDDGRLYVISGLGIICCFEAKTGEKIWAVDALERFDGRNIRWGIAESLLIDGEKVICTPGGKDATVVALNKITGETIWTSKGLSDLSAYCSAIIFQKGRERLIATMVEKSLVCLAADDGRVVWRTPYRTRNNICATSPVYKDGRLFFTSSLGQGGIMFEIAAGAGDFTRVWTNQILECQHGGAVLVDGYLYGTSRKDNTRGDWVCLEWNSGKVMYETTWNANKGSLIYADGMLYCYQEVTGVVSLARASPSGFEIVSSFNVTQGTGEHWAHPAISDGRLYIRHGDALMCYDIKAR